MTMINFDEFVRLKEDMAPSASASPTMAAQAPPVGGQSDEQEFLDFSQNIRKFLEDRLTPLIQKNPMNKQKAMQLLSTIVAEMANKFGMTASNVTQAAKAGMTTNSEPVSPPLTQPTAKG